MVAINDNIIVVENLNKKCESFQVDVHGSSPYHIAVW
jgi:hypothetical protein